MHEWLIALILGFIEGMTEFLPVSSTGHQILTAELLGFTDEKAKLFEVAIQPGALLAIVWIYRERFGQLVSLALKGKAILPEPGVKMLTWTHIAVAALPAFVIGFFARDFIKGHLFSAYTVLIGLVIGGILMIVAERFTWRFTARDLDEITLRQAFTVGVVQCLALWPGFSRSGSSISGGLFAGMDYKTSAEFSFIIAVPVMFAATAYDLMKSLKVLTPDFLVTLAIGFLVSFAVGWMAVLSFLKLIKRLSLTTFALYRFALAAVYWLVVIK